MKVRILGAHNTESRQTRMMTVLVDDVIALDAGALTSSLSFRSQLKIKAVLITHPHYDHLRDIPTLAMNFFLRERTFHLYASQAVRDTLLTHFLNGFLMMAMPIGLAIFLTRKFNLGWRLWWIGAATFILSQAGHIPFNWAATVLLNRTPLVDWPHGAQLAFNAIFLGLSAGLWEELSRYGMYRWWARDARSWRKGLLAGAGHGGAEAIILGALALFAFIQLAILHNADAAQLSQVVSVDKIELAQAQIAAYWSAPWHMSILGAVERLFAIPFHLALSLLVLQVFVRRQSRWVWLAVASHALVDGLAVYLLGIGLSAYALEGVVGLAALLAVVIIFALRQLEPLSEVEVLDLLPAHAISTPVFTPKPVDETQENLDKTKYQ